MKNKKGELVHAPLPQPTLPNITLDDEDLDDGKSTRTRVAPSAYSGSNDYYYSSDNKNNYAMDYPPPMPAYSQQYGYNNQNFPGYPPSVHTTPDDSSLYHADQYDSRVNLSAAPAPIARAASPMDNPHSATHNGFAEDIHGGYTQDSYNTYNNGGDYANYGQQAHGYDQGYQAEGGHGVYGQDGRTDYASSVTLTGGNSSIAPSRAQNASRAQQRQQYDQSAYQYDSQQHYGLGAGYADNYGRQGGTGGYAM